MISSPRAQWVSTETRFAMVPLETNRPASFPTRSAAIASSRLIVGSSPNTSSPTSAVAIASRMAGVGRVTVSLRKSMNGIDETSKLSDMIYQIWEIGTIDDGIPFFVYYMQVKNMAS
jgi:hypothetical protein